MIATLEYDDSISQANLSETTAREANLSPIRERGLDLESKRRSAATRKVYARELRAFEVWITAANLPAELTADPGNPGSVYAYLVHLADRKALATVCKVAACLSSIAQERGFVSPLKEGRVAGLLDGLRRETADAGIQQDERAALPLDDLKKALAEIDRSTLRGKRDAAILLIGFTAAMRRSEIVALNFEDVTTVKEGVTILIRRSKTDQEGKGKLVAIPCGSTLATCPVRALKDWLDASEIKDGALFRSVNRHGKLANRTFAKANGCQVSGGRMGAQDVALLVKRTTANLPNCEKLSAHSLRAGAATQAARKGIAGDRIQTLGRWRSDCYKRYIRNSTVWEDVPAAELGL